MKIDTISTLNLTDKRVRRGLAEEYNGVMIHKYEFLSHAYMHLYKDGKFAAQLVQDDEFGHEFNDSVHKYIDTLH